MDDGALIATVRNYEELYNAKHSTYSNKHRRDDIWQEIGKTMKKSGKLCKSRWTRLRDNHRKALNLRKTKSGQSASTMKPAKFEKELSFLIPYLFDEETTDTDMSTTTPTATFPEDIVEINMANDDMLDVIEQPNIRQKLTAKPSVRKTKRRKIKKRTVKSPAAASLLQQFWQEKTTNHPAAAADFSDNLTNFFVNMAQTVKTFPMRDQVEIKGKLFQIVNFVEMRIATASNS